MTEDVHGTERAVRALEDSSMKLEAIASVLHDTGMDSTARKLEHIAGHLEHVQKSQFETEEPNDEE